MVNINITEAAQDYLQQLLSKQEVEGTGVRIFVESPGTPMAETCIAYCKPGEQRDDDEHLEIGDLSTWIDRRSLPFLDEASVDYQSDRMGGQLTIRAPNSRLPKLNENSTPEDHINYVLHSEINPGLAQHGGTVMLEELVQEDNDMYAVLRFGGGCQGCSMVDMTLKDGVESTLKERVPGLAGVRDVTDHSDRTNAYHA